ncbi:unnamed protein product [Adineta ricciae]|uniref:Uncharacterized protein n=1 Tax=Adineta ricciae TaxID=249248 RepID=A0A814PDY8_ADIRI|nr:unnamed protein product [Adineta ricciae]
MRKVSQCFIFRRKIKHIRLKTFIILIIFCIFIIYQILIYFQPLSIFSTKPFVPIIFRKQIQNITNVMKNKIYDQCNSVLQRSVSLGSLKFNSTINEYYFTNYTITFLSDVYIILQFSSKFKNNNEFYIKLVSSYLLSKNLEKLPFKQQLRTNILIFLSEHFNNILYKRLTIWFKSIYEPYTRRTHIILINDHRKDMTRKFILNHTKYNFDIHLDTILFFIEDNFILQSQMLFDTIEFFATHEPCFVYHPNYFDGCQFDGIFDTNKYTTIVFGKTRLWRSILPKTFTYTGRLRTFLAFEDLFIHSNDNNRILN